MTIDAEIYGIIPRPKIEALLNAPPKNVSSNPKNPPTDLTNLSGSIPGNTINEPNRKMTKNPRVMRILSRSSTIDQIFLRVVKNFFIL